MVWFDESRLDDERALGAVDLRLRTLAESGPRVRREFRRGRRGHRRRRARAQDTRPRAVIAAGPDSCLLRAVLEPWCPVPFVAWPGPALPGWAGSLDLVVVLAPSGSDAGTASGVAEAARRGCQLVVGCPPVSLVADHAGGRWTTILPTSTDDPLAIAVVMLTYLHRVGLGPVADADSVAEALDAVALACSPHRDISINPAKMLAIGLADANPVVWGGSVLAARAARRVAESIRRTSGRTALAGDAEALLPVIEAARPRDVFDDPVAEGGGGCARCSWCSTTAPTTPSCATSAAGSSPPPASATCGWRRSPPTTSPAAPAVVRPRWPATPRSSWPTYAAEYLRLGFVED